MCAIVAYVVVVSVAALIQAVADVCAPVSGRLSDVLCLRQRCREGRESFAGGSSVRGGVDASSLPLASGGGGAALVYASAGGACAPRSLAPPAMAFAGGGRRPCLWAIVSEGWQCE